MYLDHYNLTRIPFKTNPDPGFRWLGEIHKEAFSVLRYGILKSEGFLVLTGEIGTGKTTLVRHLLNLVRQKALVAFIPIPNMEPSGQDGYQIDLVRELPQIVARAIYRLVS